MSRLGQPLVATHHGAAAQHLLTPLGAPARGRVLEVFSSGSYVEFTNVVLAVGMIPPGPIHVVTSDAQFRGPEVETFVSIDLSGSSPWSPPPPTANERAALRAACEAVDIDALIDDDLHDVWGEVKHVCHVEHSCDGACPQTGVLGPVPMETCDGACPQTGVLGPVPMEKVVQLLQGRGSGLTPSGDDVVAGLMLANAWNRPSSSASNARVRLAEQMRTTNLSKSFLHWAARGQSIAPVHDLLGAATSLDGQRFTESVESLCSIGATSGRALLAGLVLGLGV